MALERRLRAELKIMSHDPPNGITAGLDGEDIQSWTASIAGPEGSPYGGGIFFLTIEYPSRYPQQPPRIRFTTRVYHPNIDSIYGHVFVDILRDMWCPALTASTILISIQSLLTDPNAEDALNPDAGREYLNDRDSFDRTAAEWTWRYAMGGDSVDSPDSDVPEAYHVNDLSDARKSEGLEKQEQEQAADEEAEEEYVMVSYPEVEDLADVS